MSSRDRNVQSRADAFFDETASYWRDVYDRHGIEGAIYRQRRDKVLDLVDVLHPGPGARLLEVGAGAGWLSVALAGRGHRVHAVDSSPEMVRLIVERSRAQGHDERLSAGVEDVHRLSFAAKSFDLVVAVGVLPWLHRPEQAVAEMARVLRPGGGLVLTADNPARLNVLTEPRGHPLLFPVRTLRRVWRERRQGPSTSAVSRQHSRAQIGRMIVGAGLDVVAGQTLGYGPFTFNGHPLLSDERALGLHRRLQALADRGAPGLRTAGWHYVVGARKP